MRTILVALAVLIIAGLPTEAFAQRSKKKDADFLKTKPAVRDSLPDATVLTVDGKPFPTAQLRGHYTVITFGCLT